MTTVLAAMGTGATSKLKDEAAKPAAKPADKPADKPKK